MRGAFGVLSTEGLVWGFGFFQVSGFWGLGFRFRAQGLGVQGSQGFLLLTPPFFKGVARTSPPPPPATPLVPWPRGPLHGPLGPVVPSRSGPLVPWSSGPLAPVVLLSPWSRGPLGPVVL